MLIRNILRSMKRGELRLVLYVMIAAMGILGLMPNLGNAGVIPAGETKGMTRADNEATIKAALERKEVAARLGDYGLTPEQVSSRLDQLSDQQVADFAGQLDKINAGGTADTLFNVILLVLLIVLILWLLGYLDLRSPVKKKPAA